MLWKISTEIVFKIENVLRVYKLLMKSEFFPEFSCTMYEYFCDSIFINELNAKIEVLIYQVKILISDHHEFETGI